MSNINEIKQLYNIFAGLKLDKLEITDSKGTVTNIIFGDNLGTGSDVNLTYQTVSEEPSIPSNSFIDEEHSSSVVNITSPAVGYFERSDPKTQEYYVKLRDIVQQGQSVGHVKVLGISYDVVAPISGKITDILIEDEQPIEYGQPIMRLEVLNEEI